MEKENVITRVQYGDKTIILPIRVPVGDIKDDNSTEILYRVIESLCDYCNELEEKNQ